MSDNNDTGSLIPDGAVDAGTTDVAAPDAPGLVGSDGNGGSDQGAGHDPLADSLLTSEDTSKVQQPGEGADPGRKEEPEEKSDVPESPEGYDLKFAEGVTVDTGMLEAFKVKAHGLGISQVKAQELADFYIGQAQGMSRAAEEAQNAFLLEAKNGWEAEIRSRPEFNREVADARRTLKAFGGPELDPLLRQSMLGSHPAFFDFVVKVGKALAEPDARGVGYGSDQEKPLMDCLWPDM